jgi:CubicO group peptidase (beta-lactamase class C family)
MRTSNAGRFTPETRVGRRHALTTLGGAAALLVGCGGATEGARSTATRSEAMVNHEKKSGRLRGALAGFVERGEVPGLVAAVRDRTGLEVEALGSRSIGGEPARRDTIFRVASMTKPVTAAATMILVDEKRLELDEPVDRLLPELAQRKVLRRLDGPLDDTAPAKRAITVRDLLTFRMGFGIVLVPPGTYPIQRAADELRLGQGIPAPSAPPAPDEWIRRLGTLPLMHQPGETWMYNTGADVLGVLIARASGKPFEVFLRERIFEPLGMKDTAFSVPESKLERFVTSYLADPKSGALTEYDRIKDGQWSRPPAFPSGAAGLVSTVDDFLAFGQMMLDKGKVGSRSILSERAVTLMTTDQLPAELKASIAWMPGYFASHGWGLGMAVVTGPDDIHPSTGTFGWDGGLGTSWYVSPKDGRIGVLLTQRSWTSPSAPEVCRAFWRAASA